MGWQGTLRDTRGHALFARLPEQDRAGLTLVDAAVWRDHERAWLHCVNEHGQAVLLYVNRITAEVLPNPGLGAPRRINIFGREVDQERKREQEG